jgi:hypothetical protein
MSGFPNNYGPGPIKKASDTMMHARGQKRLGRLAGRFTGVGGVTWNTQRDVADANSEAQTGDEDVQNYPTEQADRENDFGNFMDEHAANYRDPDPDLWLENFDGCNDGECDSGGAHLAACATHLATAKKSHNNGDVEGCGEALNGALYHFAAFHKALKNAMDKS